MQDNSITRLTSAVQSISAEQAKKPPSPHLPANPDDTAGVVLSFMLEGRTTTLPDEMFEELARRNRAIADAPREEIQNTLARQIALLEATALSLFHKAALAPTTAAAAEFTRAALATERVLIQALGAVHQMNQNRNPVPALIPEESAHADER